MKNTTKEKHSTSSEKIPKEDLNSEMITRKDIKNSPFTIISLNETNEHFAVIGEYRITEKYNKASKAEGEVQKITWNRIIQITMILIEKLKK